MTPIKRTTNTMIMEAITDLKLEFAVHKKGDEARDKEVQELSDDMWGVPAEKDDGNQHKTTVLWSDREEKKKMRIEVKLLILGTVLNGLWASGFLPKIF